jgi:hypothetical protein
MTRQDHQYVNLPRSLMEVVDACVTNIFLNGAQAYKNKKDFVIKAVVQQIENEKSINRKLQKLILQQEQELSSQHTRGGNRSKNV